MDYVKNAVTSTLLLALVAIVFTPNDVRTTSIFIVNLHYFVLSLLLTHVFYMKTNFYHVWSSMVYVKNAVTSTLLLALVAIVFTPNDVRTTSIFIVNLH